MTDRYCLWMALLFYVAASALTVWRVRGGRASLHQVNVTLLIAGFLLQLAGLIFRGLNLHRCPLTNPFEVTVFIVWALVLFYLLIGPSYRVSFLGAFTAPVVTLILLTGLLAANDTPRGPTLKHSPWVEFHAGIGILACGAFALAFVVAAMDFVQDRQLKSHHPGPTFHLLPSVQQLDIIGVRLLILGFVLLTVGMIGGAIPGDITKRTPVTVLK